jgi:hypothetical protein
MARKKPKYSKRFDKHLHAHTYISPEQEQEEDRIAAATEATVHYLNTQGGSHFGRKGSILRKIQRPRKIPRKKRTSRNRMFGLSNDNKRHFKLFLIILLFIILRSIAKGKSFVGNLNEEIKGMELGAINGLSATTLLDIISSILGTDVKDRLQAGYMFTSLGIDVSNMFNLDRL